MIKRLGNANQFCLKPILPGLPGSAVPILKDDQDNIFRFLFQRKTTQKSCKTNMKSGSEAAAIAATIRIVPLTELLGRSFTHSGGVRIDGRSAIPQRSSCAAEKKEIGNDQRLYK